MTTQLHGFPPCYFRKQEEKRLKYPCPMWAIIHSVSVEGELEAGAFFINGQNQIQSKLWKTSDCFLTREIKQSWERTADLERVMEINFHLYSTFRLRNHFRRFLLMPAALAGLEYFVISDKHCKTSHCVYHLRAAVWRPRRVVLVSQARSPSYQPLNLTHTFSAGQKTLWPLPHAEALPSLYENIYWH